jgi:hypothetical protein
LVLSFPTAPYPGPDAVTLVPAPGAAAEPSLMATAPAGVVAPASSWPEPAPGSCHPAVLLITKIEAGAARGVWTTTVVNDQGWG